MIEVQRHQVRPVTPPATYDILGLTESQADLMAYVFGYLITGHDVSDDTYAIYEALLNAGADSSKHYRLGDTIYVAKDSS